MRHLYGVALAVVLAAAVFFAATWGYMKVLGTPVVAGQLPGGGGSLLHDHTLLQGGGALLGVGLLAGLLMVVPWVSPLASGLPGLVLVGWTALYLSDVRDAVRLIPLKSQNYGTGFEGLLFDGMLAAAGVAMIIPLFIPSRWRRGRRADISDIPAMSPGSLTEPISTYTERATQGGGATTSGSGLLSDWAETRPHPPVSPSQPPRSQAPWGPADYT
jgi:hypothetical protein